MPPPPGREHPLQRRARFDSSRRYRYWLARRWRPGGRTVIFVLLNPSRADARRDDPTLRRCTNLARAWDFAALEVVNLFAWRTPHPRELKRAARPVGRQNDEFLVRAVRRGDLVVLAWGVHGSWLRRDAAVLNLLRRQPPAVRQRIACLGLTRSGQPRHVLYLPRGAMPQPWALPACGGAPGEG